MAKSFSTGTRKGSALWEKKLLGYVGIRDGGSMASLRIPRQGTHPRSPLLN